MEERRRLILVHILQSIALAITAGVTVAILQLFLPEKLGFMADRLAILGQYWIGGLIIFVLACVGITLPDELIPVVRSLKRLHVHFGILVKVVIGAMTYLLLLLNWPYSKEYSMANHVSAIALLFILCVVGLLAGYGLACLVKKRRTQDKIVASQPSERKELDAWMADDQPIQCESDGPFASHAGVARRVIKRLFSEPAEKSHVRPNVALIGPYGSGKTSICNLVEDIYRQDRKKSDLPEMVFCRFEAWQFLSAEAAVRNLIAVAADGIQEKIDVAALWRIPEQYVEAIKDSGSWWTKSIGTLLGGSHSTKKIISAIGDVLVRLNVRLVIFVDDFDRIEEDSFATQQAIAKALNQLQSLPNTQYLISVGPTTSRREAGDVGKRSWDLLKLTRFQELVPKVDPTLVVDLIKQLREQASTDEDCYFPWSEIKENERDPLAWNPNLPHLYSEIGFLGRLIQLVNTPRTLKCTLRESNQAWEGGLKGEIDWHDLILANALKAAEPGVFEWIARDRNVFLDLVEEGLPLPNRHEQNSEAAREYALQLEQQLIEHLGSKDPARVKIVRRVISELFPAFETKLKAAKSWAAPVPQWSQKICVLPNHGSPYMERFFAGCVLEADIADQPILRYIRRIIGAEFNANEFESLCLDSQEKLTGPLNKIVQFAELIPRHLAYRICDAILWWLADPGHAECWPDPDRFIFAVLPDVFTILDNAGSRQAGVSRLDDRTGEEREEWLTRVVQVCTPKAPLLATNVIQESMSHGYKEAERLPEVFLQRFAAEFIQSKRHLLPSLGAGRFTLAWLTGSLIEYSGYHSIRDGFTVKILAEAAHEPLTELRERIVFSLVAASHPARSGEIRPEEYAFSVEREKNEQKYEMTYVVEALKRWCSATWSDEIVKRAFGRLQQEYNVG